MTPTSSFSGDVEMRPPSRAESLLGSLPDFLSSAAADNHELESEFSNKVCKGSWFDRTN